MRALTLTWTPITLVLVILMTSPSHTKAQPRRRNITKAQVEEFVKNLKPGGSESPEEKLKRLLECTQVERNKLGCDLYRPLVINEILLRSQIRDMGESCTSDGKYSTAIYGASFFSGSSSIDVYEMWQDDLLNTGLTFCNPFKHLSCSSISKKCECRPGTVWNTTLDQNICSVILGSYCWIPGVYRTQGFFNALYDPFRKGFFDSSLIIPASCYVEGIRNPCTPNLKLFLNDMCTNKEIVDLDENLENQFKDFPRLNLGDSCNLEHQTQLFTTTETEVNDYKIRAKKLEAIAADKTPFCDFKLLLMCGSGGKCECVKPMIYNPDTKSCEFKNPNDACQEQSTFEKMSGSFPGRVREEVMEGFVTARQKACTTTCAIARFPNGESVKPFVTFCRPCPEAPNTIGQIQLIGKNCDNALTLLLEGAPPPALPIDIPEYEKQVELLVQFNEKAKEFEKLFRLRNNTSCDFAGELEAYRSIRGIKNVELPGRVFTEQKYKDLMSSMDKIIGQFGGKGLCRYHLRGQPRSSDDLPKNRPILICGPTATNSICYEPSNAVYLDVWLKRVSGKSFETAPTSGPCVTHPRDLIKYVEREFGRFVRTNELVPAAYEYLFNTIENHWIDKTQFCNRTGGFKCTKSVYDKTNATGTCEFSKELMEDVLAELEQEELDRLAKLGDSSALSHHSIQHLLPHIFSSFFTLLLLSALLN